MNYGALIGDSLRLTLRNRYLWFFGFFAGGTGTNLFFNGSSNFQNVPDEMDNFDPGSVALSTASPALLQTSGGTVALVVGLVLLALLLTLIFIALALISHAGLVRSVAALERAEAPAERRFAATWRSGVNGMWRVLVLGVLLFLLGLGLLLAVALPAGIGIALVFVLTQSVAARVLVTVLVSLVAAALLIAIFVPLFIIWQLALRRTLLAGDSVTGCIGGGYGMFRRNLGRSLLVWLIGLVVGFGLGLALLVAAAIVGLLLFLPTIILALAEISTAAIVTGAIAGAILLALFVVASGALGTFGSAYWTLAYLRLETPAPRTEAGAAAS